MGMNLKIPSYSQLCRRQAQLSQQLTAQPEVSVNLQGLYVVVDLTGLKVYREGDGAAARWKIRQHGISKRLSWRKVHLAYDEATHQILAIALTGNQVDDASMVKPLLDEILLPVSKVAADGRWHPLGLAKLAAKRHYGEKCVLAC